MVEEDLEAAPSPLFPENGPLSTRRTEYPAYGSHEGIGKLGETWVGESAHAQSVPLSGPHEVEHHESCFLHVEDAASEWPWIGGLFVVRIDVTVLGSRSEG